MSKTRTMDFQLDLGISGTGGQKRDPHFLIGVVRDPVIPLCLQRALKSLYSRLDVLHNIAHMMQSHG